MCKLLLPSSILVGQLLYFCCSLCKALGSEDAPSFGAKTWFDDGRHHLVPTMHALQMLLKYGQMSLQIEPLAYKVHFLDP